MAGGGKHTWRSGGAHEQPAGLARPDSSGEDQCDIRFETTLNNTNLDYLSSVARGDRLSLEFIEENNLPRLVAKLGDLPVGVISHPRTLDLINCINAGNRYIATVIEREGNLCRVLVARESS